MVNVLCTLGYSPPVVTEFIDWLYKKNIRVKKVYVLGTQDEKVKLYYNVVSFALKDEFKIDTEYIELPFEEPVKEEDFIITVEKILEKVKFKGIFNIAGGRKNTVLAAYLAAMITGSKVYHIIHKDTKSFNLKLESVRSDLEIAGKNYEEFKNRLIVIRDILFPDPEEFEVIEIPVIPLTYSLISIIKKAFTDATLEKAEVELNSIRDALKFLDYIQVIRSNKVIVTDKGEKILRILELL